jgi:DNA repair protein RadC
MKKVFEMSDNSGLYRVNGEVSTEDILKMANQIVSQRLAKGETIAHPLDVRLYLTSHLADQDKEVFSVIFMDNKHKIIAFDCMFTGSINNITVYPREVMKTALKYNASALILVHNHPSGDPQPSREDIDITIKLKNLLKVVDIRVLDHLVVGQQTVSLAELGHL